MKWYLIFLNAHSIRYIFALAILIERSIIKSDCKKPLFPAFESSFGVLQL